MYFLLFSVVNLWISNDWLVLFRYFVPWQAFSRNMQACNADALVLLRRTPQEPRTVLHDLTDRWPRFLGMALWHCIGRMPLSYSKGRSALFLFLR